MQLTSAWRLSTESHKDYPSFYHNPFGELGCENSCMWLGTPGKKGLPYFIAIPSESWGAETKSKCYEKHETAIMNPTPKRSLGNPCVSGKESRWWGLVRKSHQICLMVAVVSSAVPRSTLTPKRYEWSFSMADSAWRPVLCDSWWLSTIKSFHMVNYAKSKSNFESHSIKGSFNLIVSLRSPCLFNCQ